MKRNKHYKTGRSQLFKQKNSAHNVALDDPDQLTRFMVGFFEGTIIGTFDEKPRQEWTPDEPEAATH